MEINIEQLKNKHSNKPCVIVGGSQTMHNFNYKKFNGIIIVIGSAILRVHNKFHVDYIINSNNEFPVPEIPSHLNFLNKFRNNTTWIMSDTNCYSSIFKPNKNIWDNKIKINYVKYDDRHFNQKPCSPKKNCCNYLRLYPGRKNIFEITSEFYKERNFIKTTGTSVAEAALAVSLILGCSPIFMQGIDIPKTIYNGKQIGVKYYGYPSKYADSFLDKTSIYLRKKYFFYYLKKLNFKPYVLRIIERIRIGKYHSYFSLTNFSRSKILFYKLSKLAQKKKKKIIILSKSSTLLSIKGFKYLDSNLVDKKFYKFFIKKTIK